MKLGIITDIHSNIQALTAVLNEFNKIKVDKIICCGDIIGIGINPEETVQKLLTEKEKLIAVKGNHEQYLLNGLPKVVHDNKRNMSEMEIQNHKWNHSKLGEKSKSFLKKLEVSQNIEIEGKKIYIIHYPINEEGQYKKHIGSPNIAENEEMFKGINADIFLYGHTHTYSINNKGNKWYINTGSLGCPKGSNIAKAGVLEIKDGNVQFNSINVEYDVEEIINEMNKIKMPFYEEVLKFFYER